MELSIFIDESGNFNLSDKSSPYYILTFVFHNQSDSIENEVAFLDKYLKNQNHGDFPIHSAPLIRREYIYKTYPIEKRRSLFRTIYRFSRKMPIKYKAFKYKKNEFATKQKLIDTMTQEIDTFIIEKYDELDLCSNVKIYYDNGQAEISSILNETFGNKLHNIVIKSVTQKDYKLLQVADFICTIILLEEKNTNNSLTKSEKQFFTTKEIKTMIKTIKNKEL